MTIDTSTVPNDKSQTIENIDSTLSQRWSSHFRNHRQSTILLGTITFLALIAAGYCSFNAYSKYCEDLRSVRVSGRIEAAETYITAATATRVQSVTVKEGDPVKQGQLVITLDSNNLQKALAEAGPAQAAALSAQRQTDRQVALVRQQIRAAQAKSNGFLAKMFSTKGGREKQEMQLRGSMLQAKMMSMQAHAAVASVENARSQASSKLSYFNIVSPIDGTCAVRSAEPGELVARGQVMLTLVDPNSAYLRGFVPESDIARIKIGQSAKVFLDSDSPTKSFSGRVTSIDAAPSFTPENIYLKKDRVRQVFGIKISIDHPNGLAKPGLPAEATIDLTSENKN